MGRIQGCCITCTRCYNHLSSELQQALLNYYTSHTRSHGLPMKYPWISWEVGRWWGMEALLRPHHGEIWRAMHCRLCINCYETGGGGANIAAPHSPPITHKLTIAGSVTVNAKTTVHCSPDSFMAHPPPFNCRLLGQIFKDDVNGFPSISDICFMRSPICSYMLVVKGHQKKWRQSRKT
jgi:hypothetical protein